MQSKKISVVLACIALGAPMHSHAQTSCLQPPAGLVSWWPGDTNENDIEGINNPTSVNGVRLVKGEVLDGFTFKLPYSYIYIAPAASLENQKFTWAAWAKPKGPGPNNDQFGSKIIVQPGDDYNNVIGIDWRANPDPRFLVIFGNDGSQVIYSKDMFPSGKFYFVAATYDGNTLLLYVDGKLEGSLVIPETINYNQQDWVIGAEGTAIANGGFPRTFNGVIDEVQAFNVPLSAAQLRAISKAGHAGECKP
jgi:hypothetical protein